MKKMLVLAAAILSVLVLAGMAPKKMIRHGLMSRPTVAAPTNVSATFNGTTTNSITWTASATPNVTYHVMRSFGGQMTEIGTTSGTSYNDTHIVSSSHHYYHIAAVSDVNGKWSSYASDDVRPVAVTDCGRLPYYYIWFADPPQIGNGVGQWTTTQRNTAIASLASHDAVVLGPFMFEDLSEETFYTNFVDDIRAINPDEAVFCYIHPWQIPPDAAQLEPSTHPYRAILSYCSSLTAGADTAGFARNVYHEVIRGKDYPGVRMVNYTRTGMADRVAKLWVDRLEEIGAATGFDADNVGVFVDDASKQVEYYDYWSRAPGGTYTDVDLIVDADQDGTVYASDADERLAFRQYILDFVTALRREFGERGMSRRLVMLNTDLGQATSVDASAQLILDQVDGVLHEAGNRWPPGSGAADSTWARNLLQFGRINYSQLDPPLNVFGFYADSNSTYQSEVLALATDGWATNEEMNHSPTFPKTAPRRLTSKATLPALQGVSYANGSIDTIWADCGTVDARLRLARTNSGSESSLWAYLITSGNDTISRGGGWIRKQSSSPPPSAPVADFTVNGTSLCLGSMADFDDQSTNTPTSWSWSFGDGQTSTAQDPSHEYSSAGTYTVTLQATNSAGSDTETKTGYITVGECSVSITGTHSPDDIFDDGEFVIVDGTGFGTKTNAAPLQFDDFEEGTDGTVLVSTSGTNHWNSIGSNMGASLPQYWPHYEHDAARLGNMGLLCDFSSPVSTCQFAYNDVNAYPNGYYLDFWIRYFHTGNLARSWKPWDTWGGTNFASAPQIDWHGDCDGSLKAAAALADNTGWELYNNNVSSDTSFTGSFHHVQVVLRYNSPYTVNNGILKIYLDCVPIFDSVNRKIVTSNGVHTTSIDLGYYLTLDQQAPGSGCLTPRGSPAAVWWDDVYVDGPQARIELGDDSNYDSCTVREIQIPSAWSSTSATFNVRWGAVYDASKAYLFVTDDMGHTSAGYQVYHN